MSVAIVPNPDQDRFEIHVDQFARRRFENPEARRVPRAKAIVQQPSVVTPADTERRIASDHEISTIVIWRCVPPNLPEIAIDVMYGCIERQNGHPLMRGGGRTLCACAFR